MQGHGEHFKTLLSVLMKKYRRVLNSSWWQLSVQWLTLGKKKGILLFFFSKENKQRKIFLLKKKATLGVHEKKV